MRERRRVTKSGFTMVEILVATTILVIAMASIYMSFRGGVTSWTKGTARMERYLNARAALDMMSREIEAAMLAASDLYIIDFIYSADTSWALRFAAPRDSSGSWDLCEIAYGYDSGGKEIDRALDVDPNFSADDKPNLSSLSSYWQPLVSNITSLQFELFDSDDSTWRLYWDSRTVLEGGDYANTEDELPEAVKITITVQDEQSREEQDFSTTVYLPTSR